MLSHRIIPTSAVLLAVVIGSAAAQEQPSAGKPLQLLQFARHEAKAPARPHARTVEKLAKHAEVKRHIAKKTAAKHHKIFAAVHSHAAHPHRVAEAVPAPAAPAPAPKAAQPAPAASPAAIWPAVDSATPGSIAVPAPPAAPQNVKTEPVLTDAPNAIATDGTVAQAAPAPETNAPAVAADIHPAAAAPASAAPAPAPAPAQPAAAAPAVRAMLARPAPADADAKSPIGSAPWLFQVLAALGGALAAGAVAGFLILRGRSEPRDEEFFAGTLAPGE